MGFRVTPDTIIYSILDGNKQNPAIKSTNQIKLPKGYKRIDSLKWLYNEMILLFKTENAELIAIKETEAPARHGNKYIERVENETVIILAGSLTNIKNYYKKVKSTIAKDLTGKGKSKYLETKLETSILPDFSKLSQNQQEAVLVAWSVLP
jgi:hypothetical protein